MNDLEFESETTQQLSFFVVDSIHFRLTWRRPTDDNWNVLLSIRFGFQTQKWLLFNAIKLNNELIMCRLTWFCILRDQDVVQMKTSEAKVRQKKMSNGKGKHFKGNFKSQQWQRARIFLRSKTKIIENEKNGNEEK